MKTLLKNGTLIDYKTNTFEVLDILIENDKIKKISKEISEEEIKRFLRQSKYGEKLETSIETVLRSLRSCTFETRKYYEFRNSYLPALSRLMEENLTEGEKSLYFRVVDSAMQPLSRNNPDVLCKRLGQDEYSFREAKEAFDEFREKIEIYPGYEEFDFSEFDQKRYLYGVKMTFIILARALGVTTDLIPAGSNDFYSLEDLSSEVVEIVSNALRKYGWNVEEVDIPTSDYDEDTQEEMWEEMRKEHGGVFEHVEEDIGEFDLYGMRNVRLLLVENAHIGKIMQTAESENLTEDAELKKLMDLVNWLFLECESYFDDMPNASGYTWDDGVYHTYRLLYDTSSEMNSVGHEIFPIPFLYLPEINRLIESLESKYF